jgi:hypothetical protein
MNVRNRYVFAAALGVFFGLEVLDSDHFLGFLFLLSHKHKHQAETGSSKPLISSKLQT